MVDNGESGIDGISWFHKASVVWRRIRYIDMIPWILYNAICLDPVIASSLEFFLFTISTSSGSSREKSDCAHNIYSSSVFYILTPCQVAIIDQFYYLRLGFKGD